ncbi:MAG: hypothetical protein ACYCSF_06235 [Acidimicrobiales bacterium]
MTPAIVRRTTATVTFGVAGMLLLSGCAGAGRGPNSAAGGRDPGTAGSPVAAVLARVRAVMSALTSYSFTFSATTGSNGPSGPTTVIGQGRVSRPGRMLATFVTSGSTLGVLVAGKDRYVRYPGQPWHRDANLSVHPVAWDSLLGEVGSPHLRRGAGGAATITASLDASAVVALGFGHSRSGNGRVTLELDATDHVTVLVVESPRAPLRSPSSGRTGVQGSGLPANRPVQTIDRFTLSGFDTTAAVPPRPPPMRPAS